MKPSNKVLTVTFLLSASLIFIIPAAVNIKHSYGGSATDTTKIYRILHPAKVVLIKGVSNCLIVPSDSFRIASSKKYINDVLNIKSKDTLSLTLNEVKDHDSTEVILYIPIGKVDRIISYSSNIKLMGKIRPNELPSYYFELHSSAISLAPFRLRKFFNRLEFDGQENSSLIIPEFNHVNELSLNNINKISISPRSEITDFKTTFNSKSNVQMVRANGRTEITGN